MESQGCTIDWATQRRGEKEGHWGMGRTSPDQANSPSPSICLPPPYAYTNTAWQRVGLEKYKIEINQIPLTPPIFYHFEPTWVSTVADGTAPISILPPILGRELSAPPWTCLPTPTSSLTASFLICKIRQVVLKCPWVQQSSTGPLRIADVQPRLWDSESRSCIYNMRSSWFW